VEHLPDPLSRLGDCRLSDFELYFESLRKSEKHGRPRLVQQSSTDLNVSERANSIVNIPQLFLSSQFRLSDTATFNLVFPDIISSNHPISSSHTEEMKSRRISTNSEKLEETTRRQSSSSTNSTKSISNGIARYVDTKLGLMERAKHQNMEENIWTNQNINRIKRKNVE
jgi:hypothetical protein